MTTTLAIIESATLLILAGIHFNWAIGGTWGFEEALPTNEAGERVLNPKKSDSAIVGLGLMSFATYFLVKINLIQINLPSAVLDYGAWFIASIFLLRAIGDFRYIGFSKKIKHTDLAKLDSKLYSPLCLALAILGATIALRE
ncbi:DUF3995 domain-containing protein [bacterium AH-315-J21]|nr:DUF3995 domain-containing protein [bacterium AH-315-J21]